MSATVDIIKTNLHIGVVAPVVNRALIAKTNLSIASLLTSGHYKLAKTNLYISNRGLPGQILLTKTNLHSVLNGAVIVSARVHPGFIDAGENEIFIPSLTFPKFTLKEVERNPYRPHMASATKDITEDFNVQQRTLRDQHNKIQGGDTTYDYGLLLKTYPKKEFTLGSLGRFYHDDYGLIMARFVQFQDWVADAFQAQPVGRFKLNNAKGINWVYTNDFARSGSDLVGGVTFFADSPADGSFGWMVVSGANITNLRNGESVVAKQDETYTWTATGTLGLTANGRIVGRKWGNQTGAGIPPGGLFIDLEGPSAEALIEDILASIQDDLDALADALSQLNGFLTRLHSAELSIDALQVRDTQIVQQFLSITNALSVRITALSNVVAVDWGPAITSQINTLRAEMVAADAALLALINAAKARADAAYFLASQINPVELAETLANIAAQLGFLAGNAAKIFMPVVDGSIPPTFIQNPDGGLVYVRIE